MYITLSTCMHIHYTTGRFFKRTGHCGSIYMYACTVPSNRIFISLCTQLAGLVHWYRYCWRTGSLFISIYVHLYRVCWWVGPLLIYLCTLVQVLLAGWVIVYLSMYTCIGSAGGLGRAFAEKLLKRGSLVCISDIKVIF